MRVVRWHRSLLVGLGRLRRDQRGAVLIYVTVTIGVMFGLGGLAIDGARVGSLHTEAQSFADHLALAAAGELDGNGDAITRADAALNNLLQDWQTFADSGPGEITEFSRRYLWGLPASDDDPITADFETTDPFEARFVEVGITLDADLLLLPGLGVLVADVPDAATAAVTAVAGFTQFVCDITPLMICNPEEDAGGGGDYNPVRGRQLRLKMQGSGSQWAPGGFGLLDAALDPEGPCPVNEGADSFRCAIAAREGVTRCFAREGVDVRPGELGASAESGFNVRFDMWEGSMGSRRNDFDFAPAVNVTKAQIPRNASCNQFDPAPEPPDPAATVHLPQDGCFVSGTCSGALGHLGDSSESSPTWSTLDYWDINHSDSGVAYPGELGTRHEIYLHEIANGIPDKSDIASEDGDFGENGNPTCAPTPDPDPDRRTLVAGVVNCIEHGVQGNAEDVPVLKFVKLFMTQPAGDPDVNDLWTEELRELQPGDDDGILHDFVQLYR